MLLVHWSPDCRYCRQIAPDLAGLERLRKRKTELVLVSYGSREAMQRSSRSMGSTARVLLQMAQPWKVSRTWELPLRICSTKDASPSRSPSGA